MMPGGVLVACTMQFLALLKTGRMAHKGLYKLIRHWVKFVNVQIWNTVPFYYSQVY